MADKPRHNGKAKPRARRASRAPGYLKNLSTSVREHFSAAVPLPTFLATAGSLDAEQRKVLVHQALILIEQNYVHLPLKRAMHAVDPVQRLRLLLQELEYASPDQQLPDLDFQRELSEIFTSVRDLHTNYLLPDPYNRMTAFLPFMVEAYYEGGSPHFIVTHITRGFSHPSFVPGVEVLHWNGVPIERAVFNNSLRYAGSNREARRARGIQTLTTRALATGAPPDEEWVIVGYRTADGKLSELRLDWMVAPPMPAGDGASLAMATSIGLDLEQDVIQRLRKGLFAPQVVAAQKAVAEKVERGDELGLESTMPEVFEARPITTPAGTFGYIRIRTFRAAEDQFVEEFVRLLSVLPANGLILDVRGNGGGKIPNGERILQTLTPRRIEPEPVQFVNTQLNLKICKLHGADSSLVDLSKWLESMRQALQTGSAFSAGFPISDPEACNSLGQKYFGPVILITDALCYSATDIFAAGFQDHEIGKILGVDRNTGAGGANVWTHQLLSTLLSGDGSPYQPLPGGAGMRIAMRRTLRVGRRAGTPVEDLGVVPEEHHFMTRNDLLSKNVDLLNKAGSMLADPLIPLRGLEVSTALASETQVTLTVTTKGMTRLDLYLADRPIQSADIETGRATTFYVIKANADQAILEIQGFDGSQLVARYRASV